jgi:hypothetical protein
MAAGAGRGDMLEAVAKGFFGRDYAILSGGRDVGMMHTRAWGDGATARVDGVELAFERTSFWSRQFTGSRGGVEFAHAGGHGPFRHTVEFVHGERHYDLAHAGLFTRELAIRNQNLRVGTVRASGFGHRHIMVEAPSDWPIELCVFALWLSTVMWKRRTAAAVVAAGG